MSCSSLFSALVLRSGRPMARLQPVGGRQPAHWLQVEPGDGWRHMPAQDLPLGGWTRICERQQIAPDARTIIVLPEPASGVECRKGIVFHIGFLAISFCCDCERLSSSRASSIALILSVRLATANPANIFPFFVFRLRQKMAGQPPLTMSGCGKASGQVICRYWPKTKDPS